MRIMKGCIIGWLLGTGIFCYGQTFKGFVKNAATHKGISDVAVMYKDSVVAVTNAAGFFSFFVKANNALVTTAGLLYQPTTTLLLSDRENNILLYEKVSNLDSVSVIAYRLKRGNNSFSYTAQQVKGLSNLVGETDVMRYISILPGVSQGMEGGLGYYIRGGGNGNNRVELDQVPVYGPTHLLGMFSTFAPAIVKDAVFQMGGSSVASGNALSSLLQINTVTPDLQKYQYDFSISPFMADASVNGYIQKNKLGYQVAARSSLLRWEYALLKSSIKATGDFVPKINDGYAKVLYKISEKQNIQALLYASEDYLYFKPGLEEASHASVMDFGIHWGNTLAKLEWNKSSSRHWSTQVLGYYNAFYSKQRQQEFDRATLKSGLLMENKITETALRLNTRYQQKKWNAQWGLHYSAYQFQPATQKTVTGSSSAQQYSDKYMPHIVSLFSELQYAEPERYKIKMGLRGNYYTLQQDRFLNGEIRLLASYFINKNMGVEATYDHNSQYYHSLEGLPVGWSLDLTVPATARLQPERSKQLYAGLFAGNRQYYATVGGYYKQLSHLAYYKSTTNLFGVRDGSWEDEIVTGSGTSLGGELWLEKRTGIWTWSLAYTISKTDRLFTDINNGQAFPFKFDRRHVINYQSFYSIKKTQKKEQGFTVSVLYSSGNRLTIPVGKYAGIVPPFWDQKTNSTTVSNLQEENAYTRQEMSSLNGYKVQDYFRVDVGYTIVKKKERYNREFIFSIYNILNRHNPYLIFHESNKWQQLSILPIVPSVKWRVFF